MFVRVEVNPGKLILSVEFEAALTIFRKNRYRSTIRVSSHVKIITSS
jgi:hypothetical protein